MDDGKVFYCPNYVVKELFSKKDKILKCSALTDDKLIELLNIILERIHFINLEMISETSKSDAYLLCKDVDLNDIPFVSLAIELNALLWTGDKKLKQGLSGKGFKLLFDY